MNVNDLIPDNIESLKPYAAGKTIAEVLEQYNPKKISKLASNENRMGCSENVSQAVHDALNIVHDYPDPVAGKLREKIAKIHQVNESEVLLAAGSESIISIICKTFFKDHENAITANATFVGFFVQTGVRGVKLKKVPIDKNYKFNVDEIINAVDTNTKMIYIANPNNPTGTYINKDEFRKLRTELPDDILLVMDEAYHEFARSVPDYPDSLAERKENIITLRTFSKAYGLAGFRVGYAVADERLIEQMLKAKLTFEPTTLAQAAALAALEDQQFIDQSVEMVTKGRERLYKFFDQHDIEYVGSIANSVMIILDNERDAIEVTQKMLEQGVILRYVDAFGLPNCIRITIGTEDEMTHFEESYLKFSRMFEVK